MPRIPTRRCEPCRESEHESCKLVDCYCNCGGMQVEPYKSKATEQMDKAFIRAMASR